MNSADRTCSLAGYSTFLESRETQMPPPIAIHRREGRLSEASVRALTSDLAATFGNKLVTSQAVREQHGHTLTWLANAPPDAVLFAESAGCLLYTSPSPRDS